MVDRKTVVATVVAVTASSLFGCALVGRAQAPQLVREAVSVLDGGFYATSDAWGAARQEALASPTRGVLSSAEVTSEISRLTQIAGGRHSKYLPTTSHGQDSDTDADMDVRVRVIGAVGVVSVPGVETSTAAQAMDFASRGAAEINHVTREASCGWVVDLRYNRGGNMYAMLGALSPLLPHGTLLSFEDRDGGRQAVRLNSGELTLDDEVVLVWSEESADSHFGARVAVLQGQMTASAGEAVLLAFRTRTDTQTFGSSTAGLSSGNEEFLLSDGSSIILTTSVMVDVRGAIHGGVIDPDREVSSAGNPLTSALDWLDGSCDS